MINRVDGNSSRDGVVQREMSSGFFRQMFGGPLRVIFGCVTIFSGIVGIWQWIDSRNSVPNVVATIIDSKCLSHQTPIEGLKNTFRYYDKDVNDLWVAKVAIVNECSRSIIGVIGGDLMSTNIAFGVDNRLRIVSLETERNDFDACINYATNSFSIAFKKWNPGERCVLRLVCEGCFDEFSVKNPTISVLGDPLKHGSVSIVAIDSAGMQIVERNLLTFLPKYVRGIVRWCGIVSFGIIFLICFVMFVFVVPWIGIIRRRIWRLRHWDRFVAVANTELESFDPRKGFREIPLDFWSRHSIPMPILRLRFVDENPSGVQAIGLFLILSTIALFGLITV